MPHAVADSWLKPGREIWDCPMPGCQFHVLTPNGEPVSHMCPYTLIKRKDDMPAGPSIIEKMWAEADRTFELFNSTPDSMDARRDQLKGRLRGLCFALSLCMTPHFNTEDEVAREIIKRNKSGSEYETPGIGVRRYEPPVGTASKYEGKKPEVKKNPGNLTDEQVAVIKERADWPEQLLATAFTTNIGIIRQVRAL
jgi:hypothetical protein